MSVPVLTAAAGAAWESALIAELAAGDHDIMVARRCVDIVDLLAVAASGQGVATLVDAQLRKLDADAVDRLTHSGVAVVAVTRPTPSDDEDRLRNLGVSYFVPADAGAAVVAAVLGSAIAEAAGTRSGHRPVAPPTDAAELLGIERAGSRSPAHAAVRQGSVVAVWGPTGAPGRTTVAVTLSYELARLSLDAMLIDADVYGGVVASTLGLLDESPGLAAACRHAQSRKLDPSSLAQVAWQINPKLRVLTGISRAERWPELRTGSIECVLSVARNLAEFTIVDVGFSLESDEELSFDTIAPRRNGATLSVLDDADLILAVGSGDPIGIQRLVRGLNALRDADVRAPVWIVLNRVRGGAVPGDPAIELDQALQRFIGQSAAALLPYDLAAVDAAVAVGKFLGEVTPHSPLCRAVAELASAIGGIEAPTRRRWRRRAVRHENA
jgi:Flp pilus assembly CpaE family ATPase